MSQRQLMSSMSNAELEDWITYFQIEREHLEQSERKQQSTEQQLSVLETFVAEAEAEEKLKEQKKVKNGNSKPTNR